MSSPTRTRSSTAAGRGSAATSGTPPASWWTSSTTTSWRSTAGASRRGPPGRAARRRPGGMTVAAAEVVVDRQKLADLDEARDYDAASSYNFLNAELGRLRSALAGGAVVRVEDEAGWLVLRS